MPYSSRSSKLYFVLLLVDRNPIDCSYLSMLTLVKVKVTRVFEHFLKTKILTTLMSGMLKVKLNVYLISVTRDRQISQYRPRLTANS
jgi:hypothetical protein